MKHPRRPTGRPSSSHGEPLYPERMPVMRWGSNDVVTLADLYAGVVIFGQTGSGKTSSSVELITLTAMALGFGLCMPTIKSDETARLLRLAGVAGRAHDVVLVGPGHPARFNFLDWERTRGGPGAGSAINIANRLSDVTQTGTPANGSASDPFWREATLQLIRTVLALMLLADVPIDLKVLRRVINSAPQRESDVRDPFWRNSSECFRLVTAARDRAESAGDLAALRELQDIADFLFVEFARHDPDPRSSIVAMVSSTIDTLNDPVIRDLICGDTNFSVEDVFRGKIVILDMPIHTYGERGRVFQATMKSAFFDAVQLRALRGDEDIPCLYGCDEAHYLSAPSDNLFLTTARSKKVGSVLATQSLPNLRASFSGQSHPDDFAKQLIGLPGIKIFHANGDIDTNRYASELIGRTLQERRSSGFSFSRTHGQQTSTTEGWNRGISEVMDAFIEPKAFTELRRGGRHRGYSEAVVFRAGEPWRSTGHNAMLVKFAQTFLTSPGRRWS